MKGLSCGVKGETLSMEWPGSHHQQTGAHPGPEFLRLTQGHWVQELRGDFMSSKFRASPSHKVFQMREKNSAQDGIQHLDLHDVGQVKWLLRLFGKDGVRGLSRGHTSQRFTNGMAQLLCRGFLWQRREGETGNQIFKPTRKNEFQTNLVIRTV